MQNPNQDFWRERLNILRNKKEDDKDIEDIMLESLLKTKEYIIKNSPNYDNSFDEKLSLLMISEKVSFGLIKEEYLKEIKEAWMLMIHEYDLFASGYTAFNIITKQELLEVWEYYILDPENGCDAWICNKSKSLPVPRKNFFNLANSDWSFVPATPSSDNKFDIDHVLFKGNKVPQPKEKN